MKKNNLFMTKKQCAILFVLLSLNLLLLALGSIIVLSNLGLFHPQEKGYIPQTTATPTDPNNFIVGIWYDNWVSPCKITIRKINGMYEMTRLYEDGSGSTVFLEVKVIAGDERLIEYPNNPAGDYMLILKNGNLAFYDNEGYIYEDYPI